MTPTVTMEEIDCALETMKLIASFSKGPIAFVTYQLFLVITQAPLSETYIQEKKWEACCLAMCHTFEWDNLIPPLNDPKDILGFLDYHFDLAT